MPSAAGDASSSEDPAGTIASLRAQLASARADNKELLLRVAALMEVALPPDVQQELREEATRPQRSLPEGAGSSRLDSGECINLSTASALSGTGPPRSLVLCWRCIVFAKY